MNYKCVIWTTNVLYKCVKWRTTNVLYKQVKNELWTTNVLYKQVKNELQMCYINKWRMNYKCVI